MTRDETKQAVLDMAAHRVDSTLVPHGFRRSKRGLTYKRGRGEAQQSIDLTWRRPVYSDDLCDAHITPRVAIFFPEVTKLAGEIAGNPMLVHGYPDATFNATFGLLGPERNLVDWIATGEAEILERGTSIAAYAEAWVIPFLDEFSAVEALIEGFIRGDDRLSRTDSVLINIIAASVVCGRVKEALDLYDLRVCGRPGAATYLGGVPGALQELGRPVGWQ
jgi:hypothetical protein